MGLNRMPPVKIRTRIHIKVAVCFVHFNTNIEIITISLWVMIHDGNEMIKNNPTVIAPVLKI